MRRAKLPGWALLIIVLVTSPSLLRLTVATPDSPSLGRLLVIFPAGINPDIVTILSSFLRETFVCEVIAKSSNALESADLQTADSYVLFDGMSSQNSQLLLNQVEKGKVAFLGGITEYLKTIGVASSERRDGYVVKFNDSLPEPIGALSNDTFGALGDNVTVQLISSLASVLQSYDARSWAVVRTPDLKSVVGDAVFTLRYGGGVIIYSSVNLSDNIEHRHSRNALLFYMGRHQGAYGDPTLGHGPVMSLFLEYGLREANTLYLRWWPNRFGAATTFSLRLDDLNMNTARNGGVEELKRYLGFLLNKSDMRISLALVPLNTSYPLRGNMELIDLLSSLSSDYRERVEIVAHGFWRHHPIGRGSIGDYSGNYSVDKQRILEGMSLFNSALGDSPRVSAEPYEIFPPDILLVYAELGILGTAGTCMPSDTNDPLGVLGGTTYPLVYKRTVIVPGANWDTTKPNPPTPFGFNESARLFMHPTPLEDFSQSQDPLVRARGIADAVGLLYQRAHSDISFSTLGQLMSLYYMFEVAHVQYGPSEANWLIRVDGTPPMVRNMSRGLTIAVWSPWASQARLVSDTAQEYRTFSKGGYLMLVLEQSVTNGPLRVEVSQQGATEYSWLRVDVFGVTGIVTLLVLGYFVRRVLSRKGKNHAVAVGQ